MSDFETAYGIAKLMSIIIPILAIGIFIFAFILMFSPKARGKFMKNQIKATKHMLESSKNDLSDMINTTADLAINSSKNIIDKHEDTLKDINSKTADMQADRFEKTARAIKKGLTTNEQSQCKYCNTQIDEDSTFCKKCGKKQ